MSKVVQLHTTPTCPIPELAEHPVWLKHNREKKPIYASGIARNGTLDTAEDRGQLVTFEALAPTLRAGEGSGLALGPIPGTDIVVSGIDLDDCIDASGVIALEVVPILEAAEDAGAYIEKSPSGCGLKIFGLGDIGTNGKITRPDGLGLEIYSGKRYFTVTGNAMSSAAGLAPLPDVAAVARRIFAKKAAHSEDETAGSTFNFGVDVGEMVRNILGSASLHDSTRDLSASLVATGMRAEAVTALLRTLMQQCKPPDDAAQDERKRWSDRFRDIPNLVQSAVENFSRGPADIETEAVGDAVAAIADWHPREPDEVMEPVPVEWFVAELVAASRAGTMSGMGGVSKTTLLMLLGIETGIGGNFFGFPVRQGTFVLLSGEDPQVDLDAKLGDLLRARFERRLKSLESRRKFQRRERKEIEALNASELEAVRKHLRLISLVGKESLPFVVKNERGSGYQPSTAPDLIVEALSDITDLRCVAFDTLRRFFNAPSVDEEAMVKAISGVERVIELHPCRPAVVLPHHVTKAGARSGESDQYAAFGSGAIVDNTRWGLNIVAAEYRKVADTYNLDPAFLAQYPNDGGTQFIEIVPARGSLRVKKADPFLVVRRGDWFDRVHAGRKSKEQVQTSRDLQILRRIAELEKASRKASSNEIFRSIPCRRDARMGVLLGLSERGWAANEGSAGWSLTDAGRGEVDAR